MCIRDRAHSNGGDFRKQLSFDILKPLWLPIGASLQSLAALMMCVNQSTANSWRKSRDVDFLLKMDVRIESIRCWHVNAEGFTAHFTLEWSQMTAKLYSDAAISLWRKNKSVEAPSTKCTRCTRRCSEGKLLTPQVTHSWCCRNTRADYPLQQPYRDFVLHMAYLHTYSD